MKKFIFLIFIIFLLSNSSCTFGQIFRQSSNSISKTINTGGLERSFHVFVPTNLSQTGKIPLVFVFHGGGSDGLATEQFTKFSVLAEKEKFIVVYPDGIGKNWNDGRETTTLQAQSQTVDDIGFVKAMLDSLTKDYNIDEKRIFATGISNGGIFSNYIAANLSEKFAAIAPVAGGLAEPFAPQFNPKQPVSIFIIQGTSDPLVPYGGGFVARNRGRIISTDNLIQLWTNYNQTAKNAIEGSLPDIDKTDECTIETFLWAKGKNGTAEVKFYKEIGGGHTWAGGSQYLPKVIIGNVCRDFDATEAIWEFFKTHPKP